MPTTAKEALEKGWEKIAATTNEVMASNLVAELSERIPLLYKTIEDENQWTIWAKAMA